MKKILYNTMGAISLGLGILGAFLPLLPSTCFILLATWSFAKSSPTFHAWLYYKSPFSESIQNWQIHRMIPYKVKWIASLSLAFSFTLTAIMINNPIVVTCIGLGMLFLLSYLLTRPSEAITKFADESTFVHIRELRPPIT